MQNHLMKKNKEWIEKKYHMLKSEIGVKHKDPQVQWFD